MSIDKAVYKLGRQLDNVLPVFDVTGVYLPSPIEDETFRDEFGFVFLADGSVGPFYVSMGGLLKRLWEYFPDSGEVKLSRGELLDGFESSELADRALAMGTYNALSQSLMRRAGYQAPGRASSKESGALAPGDKVGMVGYFCPVIDRLVDDGVTVLVLEQSPERVSEREGVKLVTDPGSFADCREILCTASVLINNSLDALLEAVGPVEKFQIIGPTGSGLPDPLFARGVASVGGIDFSDANALDSALASKASWGKAGRKYELTPAVYPGAEALLARLS